VYCVSLVINICYSCSLASRGRQTRTHIHSTFFQKKRRPTSRESTRILKRRWRPEKSSSARLTKEPGQVLASKGAVTLEAKNKEENWRGQRKLSDEVFDWCRMREWQSWSCHLLQRHQPVYLRKLVNDKLSYGANDKWSYAVDMTKILERSWHILLWSITMNWIKYKLF
jgi:hypothetical protein